MSSIQDMRGFYDKFQVVRRSTGEEVTEATFTLIPENDKHACVALDAYANSVEDSNPELAQDLRDLAARNR